MPVLLSRSALWHNLATFRSLCAPSRIMAVVKSNAYGHGMQEILPLLEGKADWLAVHSLREAEQVVGRSTIPLLIMGPVEPPHYSILTDWQKAGQTVHVVVSRLAELEALVPLGLPFHLKVDTGMGRLGSQGPALQAIMGYLALHKPDEWRGLMTHFANVEDVLDQDYARLQLQRFLAVVAAARALKSDLLVHASASAPALLLPEARFDAVRIGISMYGLWPSRETRLSLHSLGVDVRLEPVLTWTAPIVHLNSVSAGSFIGYGCTYRAVTDSVIAVLPVGYNEGYARSLSNQAHVLIRGERAQVRGRVCMNMIMVDVTHIKGVQVGDEAVLIGHQGDEQVSAEELGALAGTINYEVVTRIHHALERQITP